MKASTVNIATYRYSSVPNEIRQTKSISNLAQNNIPMLRDYPISKGLHDNNKKVKPLELSNSTSNTLLIRSNKFADEGDASVGVENDRGNPSNFDKFMLLTKTSKEETAKGIKSNKEVTLPLLIPVNKNNLESHNTIPIENKEKNLLPSMKNKISIDRYKSPSPSHLDRKLLLKYFDSNPIEEKKKLIDQVQFNNVHSKNLEHIKKLNNKWEEAKMRSSSIGPENLRPLDRLKRIKKFFDKKDVENEEIPKDKKKYPYYYSILPGNNSECVRNCMKFRENWRESSASQNLSNLRWQQSNIGIDFTNLNKLNSTKQMVNHFEYHSHISNKLNLFINLMKYCENNGLDVFNYLPMTILIQYDSLNYLKQIQNFKDIFTDITRFVDNNHTESSPDSDKKKKNYRKYSDYFQTYLSPDKLGAKTHLHISDTHYSGKNLWLVKAVDMNCGRGIKLADSIERVEKLIKKFYNGIASNFKESEKEDLDTVKGSSPSKKYRNSLVIIQKYVEKPLLYKGRKFDIRLWALLTHKMELYVFKEGHLKASSMPFDLNNINSYIHLTNYSVQKYNEDFSKFEIGNEISFKDFQNFLETEYFKEIAGKKNIYNLYKEICEIVKMTISSVKDKINIFDRKYSFEIFGYDFILDQNFKPYLLECNTNPGLEESSPLIKEFVPRMIDDALRLTVDDIFPPKYSFNIEEGYQSPFPVQGSSNSENLWQYLCHFRDKSDLSKTLVTKKKK